MQYDCESVFYCNKKVLYFFQEDGKIKRKKYKKNKGVFMQENEKSKKKRTLPANAIILDNKGQNIKEQQRKNQDIKNKETKEKTNFWEIVFLLVVILIIGFVLFSQIDKQEMIEKEEWLVDTVPDELEGIDILYITNMAFTESGKLKVSVIDDYKELTITPDDIKIITQGVSWVGRTRHLFFFTHYTLYVYEDEYNAIMSLQSQLKMEE